MRQSSQRILRSAGTSITRNQRWIAPAFCSLGWESDVLSCSLLIQFPDGAQVGRQLLLRVEYSPLNGADRNRPSGSDLMIFPVLDKAQRHRLALLCIENLHPIVEF